MLNHLHFPPMLHKELVSNDLSYIYLSFLSHGTKRPNCDASWCFESPPMEWDEHPQFYNEERSEMASQTSRLKKTRNPPMPSKFFFFSFKLHFLWREGYISVLVWLWIQSWDDFSHGPFTRQSSHHYSLETPYGNNSMRSAQQVVTGAVFPTSPPHFQPDMRPIFNLPVPTRTVPCLNSATASSPVDLTKHVGPDQEQQAAFLSDPNPSGICFGVHGPGWPGPWTRSRAGLIIMERPWPSQVAYHAGRVRQLDTSCNPRGAISRVAIWLSHQLASSPLLVSFSRCRFLDSRACVVGAIIVELLHRAAAFCGCSHGKSTLIRRQKVSDKIRRVRRGSAGECAGQFCLMIPGAG